MGQSLGSPTVSLKGQRSQDEYWGYDVKTVEKITKTKLGKLIVEYCGNEGTTDHVQTASIRKLLQRAITNLEPLQKQYPGVWRDAELKIFDLYGNGYVVRSGQGSVKFIAHITGNGDVELSKVNDESFWTSMKTLVRSRRQNSQQLQIEGTSPDQSNAGQRHQSNAGQRLLSFFTSQFSSDPKPKESQAEGLTPSSNDHGPKPTEVHSQMAPGNGSADRDETPHGQHQVQSFNGQNAPQIEIEGPPPDQSNTRQSWLSFDSPLWLFSGSKPESNQIEGLSKSSTEHDKWSSDSPSLMESDSNDKDAAGDEQHQNNSLFGHEQGVGY